MNGWFKWWTMLAFSLFTAACSTFSSTQEVNNPMDGTAQGGDPAIFDHRE